MSKTFKNEEKEGEKIIEEKEEEREDDGEDGKGSPQTDFSRFQGLPGASHSMSGWLQKKVADGKGEGWRLFWFCFDEKRGKLHFSLKENGASIGFIGLHLLTAVGLALPHTRKKRNPQRYGHEFHIITNHRPYHFAAESNKVAKEWVDELIRWRKRNEGKITRFIRDDEIIADDQSKKKTEYQLANALTTAINKEGTVRRPSVLSLNSKQLFVEDYCHHLVQAYQQIRQQDDQFRDALVSIFSLRKQVNVLASELRKTQKSRQEFEGEVIQELKRSREDLLSTRNRLAHTKQILGVTYRSLENVTENESKLQNSFNLAKQRITALEQRLSSLSASQSPNPHSLHPPISPNPLPSSPLPATSSPIPHVPATPPPGESEKEICYPPVTKEGEKGGKEDGEEGGAGEMMETNEEGLPIVVTLEGSRSMKERGSDFHGGEGERGANRFMNLLNQSLRFFDKEKEQAPSPQTLGGKEKGKGKPEDEAEVEAKEQAFKRRHRSSSSHPSLISARPTEKTPSSPTPPRGNEGKGEGQKKDEVEEKPENQGGETEEEQVGEQRESQRDEQEETEEQIKETEDGKEGEEKEGRKKPAFFWKCGTCLHDNFGGDTCAVCGEPCPQMGDDSSDEDLTDRLVLLSNKKHNSFEENWLSSSLSPSSLPSPSALPRSPSPSPSSLPSSTAEGEIRESENDRKQEKEEEKREGKREERRGGEYSDGLSSLSALSSEKHCSPLSLTGEVMNPDAPYVQIPTKLYMEWAEDRQHMREQLEKLKGMVELMRKMQTQI